MSASWFSSGTRRPRRELSDPEELRGAMKLIAALEAAGSASWWLLFFRVAAVEGRWCYVVCNRKIL